ncbi:hypothetical protein C6Q12_26190 [Burkholderia multivorans]|nr:hypothetical protein C6Q12_26190 [Burkholderia multivorans]
MPVRIDGRLVPTLHIGVVADVRSRFSNIRANRYRTHRDARRNRAVRVQGRAMRADAMPHRRASLAAAAHRDVARLQCCIAPHLCLAASACVVRAGAARMVRCRARLARRALRRAGRVIGTALA